MITAGPQTISPANAQACSAQTVLVTGAGGFVGGHVARTLAVAGYRVRGFVRRLPLVAPADPPIEWVIGDLRNPDDRRRALAGAWGVVHCGGWVRLNHDRDGVASATNVEATRGLLADAATAGVARLIHTSTLQTIATGTADTPADEDSRWNLDRVRSPYLDSKREAERLVLEECGSRLATLVLCPGMVIGPRDPTPTSTRVLLEMARARVAYLPAGGIPVIDAGVLGLAHQRALESGESGRRYAVVGPYLSYREQAALVARLTGRPWCVVPIPDGLERPLTALAGWVDRLAHGRWETVPAAVVAGGFLHFHVSGARADAAFGLRHPPPIRSIYEALADAVRSGRARGVCVREPVDLPPKVLV